MIHRRQNKYRRLIQSYVLHRMQAIDELEIYHPFAILSPWELGRGEIPMYLEYCYFNWIESHMTIFLVKSCCFSMTLLKKSKTKCNCTKSQVKCTFEGQNISMGCKSVVIIFGFLFPIFFANIVIIPIHWWFIYSKLSF